MYDVIIKNGKIFDGSGNPWRYGNIGIKDGRIVDIGSLKGVIAAETINGEGLAVSPGFIDIFSYYEAGVLEGKLDLSRADQGITTAVTGNIGISYAPIGKEYEKKLQDYLSYISFSQKDKVFWDWHSMGDFLNYLEKQGSVTNLATMVGHGVTRMAVMGRTNREPTYQEMQKMKQYIADALAEGAFGMSAALALFPGVYSKVDELVELCQVVAEKNRFSSFYMRSEGDGVFDALDEIIEISQRSGSPINISHLSAAGKNNWGKSIEIAGRIQKARNAGVDITADLYPYLASSYPLRLLLPPWIEECDNVPLNKILLDSTNRALLKQQIHEGLPQWENFAKRAGWENVIVASSKNKVYEGKSMKEIAEDQKCDPADAMINMIIAGEDDASIVIFERLEEDVCYLMRQPYVMIASSSFPHFSKPHPRSFGTYPRFLGRYVRERGVLNLEDAVRKATSLPAQRLGLQDRGLLREGMWADIAIFDPDTIEDMANYAIPKIKPIGVKYVLVNGKVIIKDGNWTEHYGGHVLRK